jgi:phospholipase C
MTLGALSKIEHIVVLMLENRSFDSMLGYLALDPSYPHEVDGLTTRMKNTYQRRAYRVHPLPGTTMRSWETPNHDGPDVDKQLAGHGGGFVRNFVTTRDPADRPAAADPDTCCVTGYHTGDQLPSFDHLARHYTVCDRWFSSVAGATMPNRLYSVCGTSGGLRSNQKVAGFDFPIYHLPSFVRQIDRHASWRWYRHDALIPSTLSMFDPEFRFGHDDDFALYDDFAGHCARGALANVSWIEPGFFDKFGLLHENDDHPPTDVHLGQQLVREVCDAVMSSPCWPQTLLLVMYDEHGGFFDHVAPPTALDDDPAMQQYGVRVPALVVSPYARPGVCSTVFDHTSILRTILDRFRPDLDPGVMGERVATANNLSSALRRPQAKPASPKPIPTEPPPSLRAATSARTSSPGSSSPQSPQEIADLVRSSTDGLSMGAKLRDYAAAHPTGGRPIDDLQTGLLVAAGELSHLGAGPSKSDLARAGIH